MKNRLTSYYLKRLGWVTLILFYFGYSILAPTVIFNTFDAGDIQRASYLTGILAYMVAYGFLSLSKFILQPHCDPKTEDQKKRVSLLWGLEGVTVITFLLTNIFGQSQLNPIFILISCLITITTVVNLVSIAPVKYEAAEQEKEYEKTKNTLTLEELLENSSDGEFATLGKHEDYLSKN